MRSHGINCYDYKYNYVYCGYMKVLVTGADGFVGSHLAELLINKGHSVRALSQYNSFNDWGWLEDIDNNDQIEIITGDIRDPKYCSEIAKEIDIIYHLAALVAIPYSYSSPKSYIDTNILGTLNICQAALDNKVKRLVHTSTSEVYGTAQYVPIDEKHPLQPQSPYSASKIGADSIAMSFYNSFDLPLTILRPFNIFGPRQSARAIIPNIITQILRKNKDIEVGDISPTRDFSYVIDTCNAFIKVSEVENTIGKTINFGSNFEISIQDLIKQIQLIMKSDLNVVRREERLRPLNSEVQRLNCDNSFFTELTGFKPSYTLDEGLRQTIEWFEDETNLKKYKTSIYNI